MPGAILYCSARCKQITQAANGQALLHKPQTVTRPSTIMSGVRASLLPPNVALVAQNCIVTTETEGNGEDPGRGQNNLPCPNHLSQIRIRSSGRHTQAKTRAGNRTIAKLSSTIWPRHCRQQCWRGRLSSPPAPTWPTQNHEPVHFLHSQCSCPHLRQYKTMQLCLRSSSHRNCDK